MNMIRKVIFLIAIIGMSLTSVNSVEDKGLCLRKAFKKGEILCQIYT